MLVDRTRLASVFRLDFVRVKSQNCGSRGAIPKRSAFQMTLPLFQLRMIRKSDSDPRAMTASSTPSTRSAISALGLRLRPAPISFSAGDCSHTTISAPRRSSASAAARPPTPPPTMAMRGARVIRARHFAEIGLVEPKARCWEPSTPCPPEASGVVTSEPKGQGLPPGYPLTAKRPKPWIEIEKSGGAFGGAKSFSLG
jgi:hypothetical protein